MLRRHPFLGEKGGNVMGCSSCLFFGLLMQLRNLVWATSKHDVFLMSQSSIIHWLSLTCAKSEVLNFSGHVAPSVVSSSRQFFGLQRNNLWDVIIFLTCQIILFSVKFGCLIKQLTFPV